MTRSGGEPLRRILFVGDLHARPSLLPLVDRLAGRHDVDRIILLGDVMDDWHESDRSLARWAGVFAEWARSHRPPVILLAGNHDAPYLLDREHALLLRDRGLTPGFHPGAWHDAHRMLNGLDWRVAWAGEPGLLASHAGVTLPWAQVNLPDLTARGIAGRLNHEDRHRLLFRLMLACGRARGGSMLPGPLWCDRRELEPIPGVTQIVGHTPVPSVIHERGSWFVDTMSRSPDGMPLGDRGMLLWDGGMFRPVEG